MWVLLVGTVSCLFSCSVSANLAQPTHNIHAPFLSVARLLWLAGAGASTKRRKKDDAEDEEDVDLSSVVRHSSKADKARNQVRDGCQARAVPLHAWTARALCMHVRSARTVHTTLRAARIATPAHGCRPADDTRAHHLLHRRKQEPTQSWTPNNRQETLLLTLCPLAPSPLAFLTHSSSVAAHGVCGQPSGEDESASAQGPVHTLWQS
jgi:hypothetical protein